MADEQTPAPDTSEESPSAATEPPAENGNPEAPAAEETTPEQVADAPKEAAEEAPPSAEPAGDSAAPEESEKPADDGTPAAAEDGQPATEGEEVVGEEGAPAEGGEGETQGEAAVEVQGEGAATEGDGEAVAAADGEAPKDEEAPKDGEGAEAADESPKEGDGEGETQEAAEGDATTEGDAPPSDEQGDDAKPEEDGEGEEKPEGDDNQEEETRSPIPQSDTFADGERPETPVVAVTEPLSREGSPTPAAEVELMQPGTPERMASPVEEGDEEEEYYEEDEDVPWVTREELIEMYQAAQAERESLHSQNVQLQHKLAEYFRKKKTDDQRQEMDKNVTDQEQRYLKYMSNLEDLRKQQDEEENNLQVQLEELKEKRQEKLEWVEKESSRFGDLKKHVALEAINSRSGRPLTQKDVELYLFNEMKKEEEVKGVRLENIKLKNRLKKREQQLKAKEELAEGLHLIDFEQLKIENQTYNEKIEERNEELLKLRKKITSTVQVLTHVKEKLQFVQAENHVQKGRLRVVEATVAQKRDVLSRTKKARDSLRIDNQRLRQKSGLLGNTSLLRDFEERKDEGDALREKLERLKRTHAEMTLNCAGVRRKIEQARAGRN